MSNIRNTIQDRSTRIAASFLIVSIAILFGMLFYSTPARNVYAMICILFILSAFYLGIIFQNRLSFIYKLNDFFLYLFPILFLTTYFDVKMELKAFDIPFLISSAFGAAIYTLLVVSTCFKLGFFLAENSTWARVKVVWWWKTKVERSE